MRSRTVLRLEANFDGNYQFLFLCIELLLVFILRFPSQAYLYLLKVRVHRTASLFSLLTTAHSSWPKDYAYLGLWCDSERKISLVGPWDMRSRWSVLPTFPLLLLDDSPPGTNQYPDDNSYHSHNDNIG